MSSTPDITVAVCTRNRRDRLAATLASIDCQEAPAGCVVEVLVVDNGSTDGTADMVAGFASRCIYPVRLVREDRPGVAVARNRAVGGSAGGWIAFIDDDETAAPGWLCGLYDAVIREQADCAGGRLELALPAGGRHDIRGAARKHLDETSRPGGFASRFVYTGPGTGNVIIRRAVFDAIGGFDETLAYRGEDQDFFRRAAGAGFRIVRTGDALVYHHLPPERLTRTALAVTARTNGRSLAYFDRRYGGAGYLVMVMALRMVHAAVIGLPRYLWASVRRDSGAATGWACSLATARAYLTEGVRVMTGSTPTPVRKRPADGSVASGKE